MRVTAIIAAGGRGSRFGADRPKQFLELQGQSILERSVRAFLTHVQVDEVVVALPAELMDPPPHYLDKAHVVKGGERRQDSVANAFRASNPSSDVIVIHDAARPFVSADLISRTIAAASEFGAALAAIGARDTVKRVRLTEASRSLHVVETIARETVYLAQTPQAFRRDVLADALAAGERGGVVATDEAALAERAGHPVHIVEGDASNIKITTPDDLPIAQAIADREGSSRAIRTGRAGIGYDLHRLVDGRPLIVGGVTIPFDRGPLGHSDGDVACHAATDAIFGAACLGDIGRHFPDTDPRWKGASSLDLLARASAIVRNHGFEVGNVDVTVVLEKPKIKDHIDAMRAAMANAIGVAVDRVSVKGKTNEGMDAVGRGEAIAAHAIALVRSSSPQCPSPQSPAPSNP
jgi:2-C-methyl-D-erythritol 4-phosphate cytidylyltransferase / 2-C-methyl-D-erythritol 2,4-cyclodiphosphate synthase